MDLTQLEMFNAVASTGSITCAAQRVHRVPSNLTTRIRQLEADLGVELFIRENQRLRLSPAGHSFCAIASRSSPRWTRREWWWRATNPRLFSLGSLESTAAVRIPSTLAHFNQRYPKIHGALNRPFRDDDRRRTGRRPERRVCRRPAGASGLEGLPVFPEEMMIVAPYGHAPITRASEVNGANVYAFRANCSYRRHFESWFHADRATPGRIHEMESYHGMLACVIAGAGTALIPRSMLEVCPAISRFPRPLAEEWRWLTTAGVAPGAKTRQLEAFIALLNEDRQTVVSP